MIVWCHGAGRGCEPIAKTALLVFGLLAESVDRFHGVSMETCIGVIGVQGTAENKTEKHRVGFSVSFVFGHRKIDSKVAEKIDVRFLVPAWYIYTYMRTFHLCKIWHVLLVFRPTAAKTQNIAHHRSIMWETLNSSSSYTSYKMGTGVMGGVIMGC